MLIFTLNQITRMELTSEMFPESGRA